MSHRKLKYLGIGNSWDTFKNKGWYAGILKGLSQAVLLEVLLCFLQSPQSAQQHTSLHHRAGIGLGSHVGQVIHHRQSDKSCWTCTSYYIHLFMIHTHTQNYQNESFKVRFSHIFTFICESALYEQQQEARREESSCSKCHPVWCFSSDVCLISQQLSTYTLPNPHLCKLQSQNNFIFNPAVTMSLCNDSFCWV